jgi:hypothetical protein
LTGAGLNSIGKVQQHGLEKGLFATNKGGKAFTGREMVVAQQLLMVNPS